eukprot:6671399-Prymnesium_polylepis.2
MDNLLDVFGLQELGDEGALLGLGGGRVGRVSNEGPRRGSGILHGGGGGDLGHGGLAVFGRTAVPQSPSWSGE